MSERIKRFDGIFRFLLIISTIIFSGALAFYKESMPEYFFSGYIYTIISVVFLWSIGHTRENISREAIWKLLSWFMLMFFISSNVESLFYQIPGIMELSFVTRYFLLTFSCCMTLPMYFYLKNILPIVFKGIFIIIIIIFGIILSLPELINFIQSVFL